MRKNNGIAGTVYVGLKTGKTTLGAQGAGLSWTEETFTTSGLVFGGGASFPVAGGSAGSVGVNLGLGLMGAKWEDTTGWEIKAKTALGFSLGASYTYPIDDQPLTVPDSAYFVLGDNRSASADSRQGWFVPADNLRGEVLPLPWTTTSP